MAKQLLHALGEVAVGRSVVEASYTTSVDADVLDSGVVERLIDHRSRQAMSPLRLLSVRQLGVLREMAEAKSNSSIAGSRHLSESSVEK